MIRVEFLREAEIEFLEAIVHYEEITAGFGIDFKREVETAVTHIESFPNAWSLSDDGTRHYLLHRFPYLVICYLADNCVWIPGIPACRQRPRNWVPLIQKTRQNK